MVNKTVKAKTGDVSKPTKATKLSSPKAGESSYVKVQQIRSTHGCIEVQQKCVRGLGLRRIRHTVDVLDTPSNRGMINKVKHLVRVL